jgi:hypothetical protein
MLCSVVYTEAHPRQSLVSGLAPASICHPLPFNFLRIRTSKTPLPQLLYNPHLGRPLGCAGNKGLTSARIHRQLFCNQHLRTPLASAGNKGVITLLESAVTKNAPATPLESALTKMRGEGERESQHFPTITLGGYVGPKGPTHKPDVRSRPYCRLRHPEDCGKIALPVALPSVPRERTRGRSWS